MLLRKKKNSKINFQSLADAIRVQKPYLSKVLGGKADLNFDQLYLASRYLNLSKTEEKYLQLLLDYSRSSLELRRRKLFEEITKFQGEQLKSASYLDSKKFNYTEADYEEYFLDPINIIIHMSLMIPRYQSNLDLIGRDLALTETRVRTSLDLLERLKLVRIDKKIYKVIKSNLHLNADSKIFFPHHLLMRLLTLYRFQAKQLGKNPYYTSITFTANPAILAEIKEEFLQFLKRTEKLVDGAPSESVFQLNFDIFQWNI
jgi:uncharacterized protein (TIGR02147 family)